MLLLLLMILPTRDRHRRSSSSSRLRLRLLPEERLQIRIIAAETATINARERFGARTPRAGEERVVNGIVDVFVVVVVVVEISFLFLELTAEHERTTRRPQNHTQSPPTAPPLQGISATRRQRLRWRRARRRRRRRRRRILPASSQRREGFVFLRVVGRDWGERRGRRGYGVRFRVEM